MSIEERYTKVSEKLSALSIPAWTSSEADDLDQLNLSIESLRGRIESIEDVLGEFVEETIRTHLEDAASEIGELLEDCVDQVADRIADVIGGAEQQLMNSVHAVRENVETPAERMQERLQSLQDQCTRISEEVQESVEALERLYRLILTASRSAGVGATTAATAANVAVSALSGVRP